MLLAVPRGEDGDRVFIRRVGAGGGVSPTRRCGPTKRCTGPNRKPPRSHDAKVWLKPDTTGTRPDYRAWSDRVSVVSGFSRTSVPRTSLAPFPARPTIWPCEHFLSIALARCCSALTAAGQSAPRPATSRRFRPSPRSASRASTRSCSSTSTKTASAGAVGLVLQDGKAGLRARRRLGRQGSRHEDGAGHDLPHRVADQGAHERGDSRADGGRQAQPDRSGQPLHPVVRRLEGRRAQRHERVDIVPAKRPINIRDLLTHTAGISYGTDASVAAQYEAKGLGPAAGYGWFTGGQGRTDLRDDGAARHAAVRRAAGRGVGLRLQHRHPRLHRREGERHAARRVHPHADHRSARA